LHLAGRRHSAPGALRIASASRCASAAARALAALSLCGILAGCGWLGREQLTIIVISLDTTRPDHLTPYGYDRDTTPTLARLAAEGTLFTAARSTSSWTLPSHMSLFTGLPPGLHDVTIDFQVLDEGHRTMGEIFQQAGYRTMGVFSAPYVHGYYGFDRGMGFYERATLEPMLFDLPPEVMQQQMVVREHRSHREITSRLVTDRGAFLLKNSNDRHNLLFLHYFDPHYDYRAPAQTLARFAAPGYAGPVTGDNPLGNPAVHADMPAADRAQLEALYDAELAWVDENLALLLERLERQGRLDSTLIVVTGDHGEAFFEHGRFGHRFDLTDEVLRIPLLFWWPGRIPAGHVVDEPVSIADVLPTLMDYAGLAPDPAIDGISLKPLIHGAGRPAERPVTAVLSFFPPQPQGYYVLHEAFVAGPMKLVRTLHVSWSPDNERDLAGDPIEGSERFAVYDLAADPLEARDLSDSDDPRVPRLIESFHRERTRQRERYETFVPRGVSAPPLEASLYDIMAQMGYLGDAADGTPGDR
jgi:arylsulfatase A-like enzyme